MGKDFYIEDTGTYPLIKTLHDFNKSQKRSVFWGNKKTPLVGVFLNND